jgi:hypothetical protein
MAKFYLSSYARTGLLGELRRVGQRQLEATEVPAAIREASNTPTLPETQLTILSDGRGVIRWASGSPPL